jgi:hypothetical protein
MMMMMIMRLLFFGFSLWIFMNVDEGCVKDDKQELKGRR